MERFHSRTQGFILASVRPHQDVCGGSRGGRGKGKKRDREENGGKREKEKKNRGNWENGKRDQGGNFSKQ